MYLYKTPPLHHLVYIGLSIITALPFAQQFLKHDALLTVACFYLGVEQDEPHFREHDALYPVLYVGEAGQKATHITVPRLISRGRHVKFTWFCHDCRRDILTAGE